MLSFLFKRFSGRHYRKFLEKSRPIVARINELELSYQTLTDEQLAARCAELGHGDGGRGEPMIARVAAVCKRARRQTGGPRLPCPPFPMVHSDT